MEDNNALALVAAVGSVTDDAMILQSLNLNLQIRVHNLESETTRLKAEIQSYKGKSFIYESLSKDLASLRKQFDKTAAALLRKCDAYEALKKDYNALKSKTSKSPRGTLRPRSNEVSNFQSKLALYEAMECSSDEESFSDKASRRPSIGSCGNLLRRVSAEDVEAANFGFAAPAAPLRNRLLIKLHSMKASSTESLASTGRKSIRSQEVQLKPEKPTVAKSTLRRVVSVKPKLDVITQSAKPAFKAPPSIRPALGHNNGQQKLVKMNNIASIKRSNSATSGTSSKTTTIKPAFRM